MSIIIPITFTTPDITLTWANNENPNATVDLTFYAVEVWEIDSNENPLNLKHSYEITPSTPSLDGSWTFTLANNSSIFGTVTRKFMIKIFSKDTNGDVCPDPATLILNNPAPIAPKTVSITSGNEVNYINITPSDDIDIIGYAIYRSTTSGFTPNDTNKVYEGVSIQVTLSSLAGTIYYYKVGQYDAYGKVGMIYSQEYISAVPDNLSSYILNEGGTPSIEQDIATNLPAAGTEGRLFLDTTGKLWKRDNGISWDIISPQSEVNLPLSTGILYDTYERTSTDSFWADVKAAIYFEGASGATTFTDAKGTTVTNSNLAVSTANQTLGAGSFNGSNRKLTLDASISTVMAAGPCTIEFWVRKSTDGNQYFGHPILVKSNNSASGDQMITIDFTGRLLYFSKPNNGGAEYGIYGTTTLQNNTDYHCALTMDGTKWRLWLNGVMEIEQNNSTYWKNGGDQPLEVGHSLVPSYSQYEAWAGCEIWDLRITTSVRYTATFTPPARLSSLFSNTQTISTKTFTEVSPLTTKGDLIVYSTEAIRLAVGTNAYVLTADSTAASGIAWKANAGNSLPSQTGNGGKFLSTNGSTPSWESVSSGSLVTFEVTPYLEYLVLYMPMNGANNSTNFIDERQYVVTPTGNTIISTAQSKFGGASAYFDGTGDYLSIPASPAWDFRSENLTLGAWVYIAGNSAMAANEGRHANLITIANINTTVYLGFLLLGDASTTGTGLRLYGGGVSVEVTGTISQNAWHYLSVTKAGTTVKFFVDGTQLGTDKTHNAPLGNAVYPLYIGGHNWVDYNYALNGYIDSLYITRGIALDAANQLALVNAIIKPPIGGIYMRGYDGTKYVYWGTYNISTVPTTTYPAATGTITDYTPLFMQTVKDKLIF